VDKQRAIVASALEEMERITGVPPASLGDVLASDDDGTAQDGKSAGRTPP
jgi:hypothetical protein